MVWYFLYIQLRKVNINTGICEKFSKAGVSIDIIAIGNDENYKKAVNEVKNALNEIPDKVFKKIAAGKCERIVIIDLNLFLIYNIDNSDNINEKIFLTAGIW